MIYTNRNKTDAERMAKVFAMEDCKKLAYMQVLYYCDNQRERSFDELWVQRPENMKTASYGRNWGFYVGLDEIKKHYIDDKKYVTGSGALRPMTSTALCVAEDMKTAYGLWYCFGEETFRPGEAYWVSELVAFDFINEDGEWKIWHMFTGTETYISAGRDAAEMPGHLEPDCPENPFKAPFGKPTYDFEAFASYQYFRFPAIPVPHETFNLENSCGLEANPYYQLMRKEGK